MSVTNADVQVAKLSADDRLLYDEGLINVDGTPTTAGWDLLKMVVFDANKDGVVALVKTVKAAKVTAEDEDDE